MSQISVKNFVTGVLSVCQGKPKYKAGHDGSSFFCDEIGLIRGGLLRGGATGLKNMKSINQCVQSCLKNVRAIGASNVLNVGDIVLKSIYGNYRYYDIGVVVCDSPLEIMHMTKRGIRKDKRLKHWDFVGSLVYIDNDLTKIAIVKTNERFVRAYNSPSFSCKDFVDIPNGEKVIVAQFDEPWSAINYNGRELFVFSRSLIEENREEMNAIEELKQIYIALGNLLERLNK